MCLNLRRAYRTPYYPLSGDIRYKIVRIHFSPRCGKFIYACALYQNDIYRIGQWMTAEGDRRSAKHFGFHVFTSPRRKTSFHWPIEVRVKGFLASGMFGFDQSETYEQMLIPPAEIARAQRAFCRRYEIKLHPKNRFNPKAYKQTRNKTTTP